MTTNSLTKFSRAAVAGVAVIALPLLSACSGGGTDETVTETATVTTAAAGDDNSDDRDDRDDNADDAQETVTETAGAGSAAAQGASPGDPAPCEVASFSDEARNDMAEEGLDEQRVRDVVAQGCGTAELDDGVWKIDVEEIDVEILPDGTVVDVDA